jgi:hypothetical protein
MQQQFFEGAAAAGIDREFDRNVVQAKRGQHRSDPIGDPGAEPSECSEGHAAAEDRHDYQDNP